MMMTGKGSKPKQPIPSKFDVDKERIREAISKGLKRYKSHVDCPNHICPERYVSNLRCIPCSSERNVSNYDKKFRKLSADPLFLVRGHPHLEGPRKTPTLPKDPGEFGSKRVKKRR